ncbi:MAG: sugar nucleotide-binding protein [Pseudomonadota bacterium]
MENRHVLIVGCGKIGMPLARQLSSEGNRVTGLRRSQQNDENELLGFISADVTEIDSLGVIPKSVDQAIIILPPAERTEEGYQLQYDVGLNNILSILADLKKPPECVFVSSTSVYHQRHGEWVDESSDTDPDRYNGRYLVSAEWAVLQQNSDNIIVRFSGIYGGTQTQMVERLMQSASIQQSPPVYTNRIHRTDCMRALHHLSRLQQEGMLDHNLYLATDHDPASKWQMAEWFSQHFSYELPAARSGATDSDQNKRCRNTRILKTGFEFTFPTFREGYTDLRSKLNS